MAQPSFYSEARVPRQKDTELRRWKKVLGYYADSTGIATDSPRTKDGVLVTERKIDQALWGV